VGTPSPSCQWEVNVRKFVAAIMFAVVAATATPAVAGPEKILDPTLCPILIALSANYVELLVITQEGDTYIGYVYFWDCPPYTN
jgi:hypothetical protein